MWYSGDPITGEEETVEQLLRSIRDDWEASQSIRRELGPRLARVKRLGVSWRRISEETAIPMTMVRRYAEPYLDGTAGAKYDLSSDADDV